ncbi:MAG: CoA-transferase [Candidatus Dadabacteria bacterium]|nr:MAG: CoA-transferase [Candidatus Dadabacteria bacterium]
MTATRADICVVACAEAFRGDGEIMASPMGLIPSLGARLARLTFEPDLVLTDGIATIRADTAPVSGDAGEPVAEGWMPYRFVFDTLWWGRRHVMMGATQIDRYGNQNISCIGPWERPKVQLLGARGAPGNTINHTTSYFVGRQNARVFVDQVDMVSGVGYDRAAQLSEQQRRFHEIRCVVSNLAVFDFDTPDHRMRLRSLHPGVSVEDVQEACAFDLVVPDDVPETRTPTPEELALIEQLDPEGRRFREVAE